MCQPTRLFQSVTFAGFLYAAGAVSPVLAQSNEVYLGQVGDTNKLTVDQVGEGNTVGGTADALRLNQLGNSNIATLRQVGEANGIGGLDMKGRPGFLTGLMGSTSGLTQRGNQNLLEIDQRSWRGPDGSLIGAIEQRAGEMPAGIISNRATIRQIGGFLAQGSGEKSPSSGPARHTIREILQISVPVRDLDATATGTNTIDATQLGLDQQIGQLRQSGAGNGTDIVQSGTANALRLLDQTGGANSLRLRMAGERNTLGNAEQDGLSNRMDLRLDGTGNFVDQTIQAGLAGLAGGRLNTITVSVVGNDNGGDGTGGYRAVSAQSTVDGAYASSLEQYGEGNALTLTIGSDEIGRADGNYFSAAQRGFDNTASSLMTGDGNEFALSQDGDGNWLDITQASTAIRVAGDSTRVGNTARLRQFGDKNRAELRQSGADNRLEMDIRGDRNGLVSSQSGTGNLIDVRIVGDDNLRPLTNGVLLAARSDPLAGKIKQDGTGHQAFVDIAGNLNVISVLQTGTRNIASAVIRGSGNWAGIRQTGLQQTAIFRQIGGFNSLFIRQE